jgi:Ribonuclease G/E
VILIDMPKERASQAALLVDGRLEDLLLDPLKGDNTPAPGRIYWAKVDRLIPKLGGAFVRLSPEQTGFLREAKGLKEGQSVLVQVSTYGEDGKATPVTNRVLYKSRLAIHTPSAPGINVSRRIKDVEERERLESLTRDYIADQIQYTDEADRYVWEQPGIIIRSAADGVTADALRDDIMNILTARYCAECFTPETPPLTHAAAYESSAEEYAVREWEGTHATGPDLFDHYGVWDEIERLKSPRADLPSGAWMAVEATRAMVTVDVNTAGEFGGGAALTANLEAAGELPRQLRLRGLGGQITIDFAPLRKSDRKRIEEALKTSFRRDPIETTLAGWTPLGNFELQRKRERRPLSELLP